MDSVVERRLAAILAADVVGYSKLVEADEAGTLAAIRRLRAEVVDPLLAKHHGRIVKLMGDGTIAEFGSVVDAVCCAVAVQKETRAAQADVVAERRITFRIGVNLGDVVVEGDDLLGDGVNVAARLEQLCDPGGVLISGTAFDHLRGRLDLPLDDAGEQHVKNISRPVRTYRVRLEGSGQPWRLRARQHIGRLRYAAAILVVLGLAGAGYWWMHPIEKAEAKPSIAVLPFDNMGGDEATGRLADGITEDIITDLARFRELDVIARNSTEAYSGKAVDVRQVGKDLNVGYVMEGSIQREGDQIRVTAQLIATADGSHSWSQRWDRPAGDVFAVQTEIADHVANALGGHGVIFSESRTAAKRKRPADLQAYDLYILSVEADLVGTESSYEKGLAYIDAAIARDPDLARAYIQKGWLLFHLAAFRNNWNETFVELESLARTAISIDPNDATSQAFLALAVGSLGRNAEAAEASARAIQLNPGSADVLNYVADGMPFVGKAQEGAAMCERAFRLNPNPPVWYYANCISSYFFTQRFEKVIDATTRWKAMNPLHHFNLVILAAAQAELGRPAEAGATVAELEQRYPDASFEYIVNNGFLLDRDQDEQFLLAAMRKAGIRICATEAELKDVAKPRRLPECQSKPAG